MTLLSQQAEILKAVLGSKTPIGCKASAGTGKTYLLTEVYRELVQTKKLPLEKILVITFSRNAASELESRITQRLDQLSMEDRDRTCILTIHGFCKWILARWGYLLGVPFGVDVLEPSEIESLLKQETEKFLLRLPIDKYEPLFSYLKLEQLSDFLLQLCQGEIASWNAQNPNLKMWAQEWVERVDLKSALKTLEMTLMTEPDDQTLFSQALSLHRTEISSLIKRIAQNLELNDLNQLRSLLIDEIPVPRGKWTSLPVGQCIRQLKDIIKPLTSEVFDQTQFAKLQEFEALIEDIRLPLAIKLEEFKKTHHVIGFQELESWCAKLLLDFPSVREEIRNRFEHILLDECQDTSHRQWTILQNILGENLEGLLAVGDVKQCLYQFRGADPYAFLSMMTQIQKKGGKSFDLENHFRSKRKLLAPINNLALSLFGTEVAPTLTSFDESDSGEMNLLSGEGDDVTEPHLIAKKCRELHEKEGIPFDDMLILLRKLKPVAHRYEETFRNHQVPLFIDSGADFFQSSVAQLVRACFEWNLNPEEKIHGLEILQSGLFPALEFEEIEKILKGSSLLEKESPILSFISSLQTLSGAKIFELLLTSNTFLQWLERLPNPPLEKLKTQTLHQLYFHFSPPPGIMRDVAFVKYLNQNADESKRISVPVSGSVKLMTVHASKGLEGHIVFIPQLSESSARKSLDQDPKALGKYCLRYRQAGLSSKKSFASLCFDHHVTVESTNESRRILYVAMTRGIDRVYFVTEGKLDEAKPDTWASWIHGSQVKLPIQTISQEKVAPPVLSKTSNSLEKNLSFLRRHQTFGRHSWTFTHVSELLALQKEKIMKSKESPLTISKLSEIVKLGTERHQEFELKPEIEQLFWEELSQTTQLPIDFKTAHIRREVPLVLPCGPYAIYGKADALWQKGNEYFVIDYKGNLPSQEYLKDYRHPYFIQVALYGLAIQWARPEAKVTSALVSYRTKKLQMVPRLPWSLPELVSFISQRDLSLSPAPLPHHKNRLKNDPEAHL